MKNVFSYITKFVFPPKCILCDQFSVTENGICGICFDKINFISKNTCKACGYPFEIQNSLGQVCGICVIELPPFEQAKSVILYDDNSNILIKKFKYYDRTELASYFAKMMYNYDRHFFDDIDIITSVPLHWKRQLKRLYNQSSLLAIRISKISGKKFIPHLVKRIKNTRPQVSLNAQHRRKNLQGAFQCNIKYLSKIKGKNILLIDDVYTTGETIKFTSQELLKLEVNKIKVLTLARSK